jgi:hypothetical protein
MPYTLAPWVPEVLKLFVGPLAGAFAGAMTAQGIAKRNATIQRQLDELRATNAAVIAASATVHAAAGLKRQHVRTMKNAYDELCLARDDAHLTGGVFHFKADLQSLPPFRTTLPMLEKLVYERISTSPGPLALYALLAQSVGGVNDAIEGRNALVKALRARSPIPDDELADIYFGLFSADGHADESFPQLIEALVVNLDCTILFGCVLTDELAKHAKKLSDKHKTFPEGARAEFDWLAKAGLIPPISDEDKKTFESLQIVPNLPKSDLE